MEYLVNAHEMKLLDQNTTEIFKVPPMVLMERAAVEVVRVIEENEIDASKTVIVCGNGNNGGDGAAVARILFQKGYHITVVCPKDKERMSESLKLQVEILEAYGIQLYSAIPEHIEPTLVIDAVFGIGLSRNIEGASRKWLEQMNQLKGSKLSIDLPSGINATTGAVMGCGFRADVTVTFAYAKEGMYLWPASEYCGTIVVRSMGIEKASWLENKPCMASLTREDLKALPKRREHSNKGTYGKVLLVAGKVNMAGAACFSAFSAYATGCGIVRIYTPEENRIILQEKVPEAILTTYPSSQFIKESLLDAMDWADAIICGPGLGMNDIAELIVRYMIDHAKVPVIFDADALNLIARDKAVLERKHADYIVTPHLGEMSRLCGKDISEIETTIVETATEFARQYQLTCVLKGEHTITCVPQGKSYLNRSGNHGMATAGSGDVLAGIIGSLVAQGLKCEEAAPLGVYLHGLAGDAIKEEVGCYGMMASDLPRGIKQILRDCE